MKISLIILIISCCLFITTIIEAQQTIEDFNSGTIDLISYPEEDIDSEAWTLDPVNTYQDSDYSLKLYGNTWKVLEIDPLPVDTTSVWQIAAYVQSVGRYQGFGLMDGENVLFYSFAGTTMLDIEEWFHVYQGVFPTNSWNTYQLPVGDDWMAWFEYEPVITSIVFVNDNDNLSNPGTIHFDLILDITEALPFQPQVEIFHRVSRVTRRAHNTLQAEVQFTAYVYDPDYDEHDFYWQFGDGSGSNEQNPYHTFEVTADYPYTVFLAVVNPAERWGFASTEIEITEGDSALPLKINFVGDIMLARRYEQGGGIIPTQGVEAIFEPTLHLLGDAADVTVINLESPLTTSNTSHPTKTICFKGHPNNVAGLTYAGVDVATLANNHILDYMLPGLQETQQVLETENILHLGAGADSYEAYLPVFVNRKGVNATFLASSDRNGHYNNFQPYLQAGFNKPGFAFMTPYYVRKQIQSVRDVSDLVVLLLHSGSEYSLGPLSHDYDYLRDGILYAGEEYFDRIDIPKMWDREIRHFMIDSGADLVINHHPHIIQGLEVYKGKLIAHSLGNFIFDLDYPETMPTMILNTEADKTGFISYSVTPVFIDGYIPQPATGELGLHILDYLARRSKDLDTYLHIDREAVRAHVILDTLTMVYNETDYQETLHFDQVASLNHSQPLVLRKNGSISSLRYIEPSADYHYRLGRELIWFGNFEDEGCTLWNTSHSDSSYDNEVSYQGERSLRQIRDTNAGSLTTRLNLRIKKYEQTDYTLYGHLKTLNASDANIEIRYYSNRTSSYALGSETLTLPLSQTNDWTFFHKELTVPTNANYFDVLLLSSGPSLGIGQTWFDNVGLIEWTDWESFEPGIEIINPNDFYFVQLMTSEPVDTAILTYRERNYNNYQDPDLFSNPDSLPGVTKAYLYNNYPNPFNAETHFSFSVNRPGKADLIIYNIKGQKVRHLFNEYVNTGERKTITWDGKNDSEREAASGIYLYRLLLDNQPVSMKKCLLLK
jgi:poly-gamma-glutamate capsule biosynthesis protein CapA/YwtB (metallophosphatase superfamily)